MAGTGAEKPIFHVVRRKFDAPRRTSWEPGLLHPNLSWTHYRALLKAGGSWEAWLLRDRGDQEQVGPRESLNGRWAACVQTVGQSRDKAGLMKLASKGHEVHGPADVFKDPVVMEFVGLPGESHRLVESRLEEALIGNLQEFLLEMGKGFAFVSRQERLTARRRSLLYRSGLLSCRIEMLCAHRTQDGEAFASGPLSASAVRELFRSRASFRRRQSLGLILCADKKWRGALLG